MNLLVIILFHAVWAISIPMTKVLLTAFPPFFLASIRMLQAGIIVLLYAYLKRGITVTINKKHVFTFIQIIFFGMYLKHLFRYWELQYCPIAKLSFLLSCTPFFIAVLSYFFFEEQLSSKKIVGLIIGFMSMVPFIDITQTNQQFPIEIFIFAEMLCYSYAFILIRTMIHEHYSPYIINGFCMLNGGILALATSYITAESSIFILPTKKYVIIALLAALIVISNIVCQTLYFHLLQKYSATFIAFTDFLSPLFTSFYAWFFFSEPLTWHHAIASILLFTGLYFFYNEEQKTFSVVASKVKN